MGIVNGIGKLCSLVYLIFIYIILTYFNFEVFVQLLCKTGHPKEVAMLLNVLVWSDREVVVYIMVWENSMFRLLGVKYKSVKMNG